MNETSLPIRYASGVIIYDGVNLLLQKRDNKDGIMWPNKISLWGGAMEAQDEGSYEANALRELIEETGLETQDVSLECFGKLKLQHQTIEYQPVELVVKLFLAKITHPVGVHAYEGKGIYSIPINSQFSGLDTKLFAPGALEAIELLKQYLSYQTSDSTKN